MKDLLSEYIDMGDRCIVMNRAIVPDGYGGQVTVWTEGAEFYADIYQDTTVETRIGQKLGLTSVYTVSTRRSVGLQPLSVFRRLSDGKTYRVTSEKKQSPDSSKIDMAFFTAEDYVLTGESGGGNG